MDRDELYDLLVKQLQRYMASLDPEQQSELDGTLWDLAQQLAEKFVAQAAGSR